MSGKMTRSSYEEMIREDLEWLNKQPRTLERDHIIMIVMASIDHEYGKPPKRFNLGQSVRVIGASVEVKVKQYSNKTPYSVYVMGPPDKDDRCIGAWVQESSLQDSQE